MNIETDRLLLRPAATEDTEEIFKYFDEKIITYMYPSVAKDISETRKVVNNFIKQRNKNTDYVYAITLKTDGSFIGLVGLHNLVDEIPELGIWTKVESHGNHYGREAIGGVIRYARQLGIKKLCYPVDKRNIPSKKVPLYYGGKLVVDSKEVKTPDGRILNEEIYEIKLNDCDC